MQNGSVMILKGSSREWLQDAISAGLLNGEALKMALKVMEENEALRRQNAFLQGRVTSLEAVRDDYRATNFEALQYKFDCERGYRINRPFRLQVGFAIVCVTAAVMCLVFALVI